MKRHLSIFLAFSVLAGITHMDELARLPELSKHYTEYRNTHVTDSVLSFLYNHYVESPVSEASDSDKGHDGLPFKSDKCFQSHFSFFSTEFKVRKFVVPFSDFRFVFYTDEIVSCRLSDIFQPPRS